MIRSILLRPLRLVASVATGVLLAALGGGSAAAQAVGGPGGAEIRTALDSAQAEIEVGRFWHASRILRGARVASSRDPGHLLLLARAEAGWGNWPEVARLLDQDGAWRTAADAPTGWLILARAHEDGGRWAQTRDAYRALLGGAAPSQGLPPSAVARLARAELLLGEVDSAVSALDGLPDDRAFLRSWVALEAAARPVAEGDTGLVATLLTRVTDPLARQAAWLLMPRARAVAGDTVGAFTAFLAAAEGATDSRRAEAVTEAGRLVLAQGDSTRALPLLRDGLRVGSVRSRAGAASALLAFPGLEAPELLAMGEVLERGGEREDALAALDRAAALSGGPASLPGEVRLARARLMGAVPAREPQAVREFRALADSPDRELGARAMEAWASLLGRAGRAAERAEIRSRIVAEFPSSPSAADILWERGNAAEGRGSFDEAMDVYERLFSVAPDHPRAGQGRMRTAQILLGRGRVPDAIRVYMDYLTDQPSGGRWPEASFWAARGRLSMGDTVGARALMDRVFREEPFSYYAVVGAELLGLPYRVEVPEGPAPAWPTWLRSGLERLDLLEEAGLREGADAEEGLLVERARAQPPAMLALAASLNERGRTVTGINLGWELRRNGAPWTRGLLEIVYPFPHRELVAREAREWGLDPITLAAIIRQESAFKADIRSHAGAVGLMQVMPPTGRELARTHGPAGFREDNLESPEVNLHLGSAFFRDMSRRYGGDLPLVLSAYNAGPTRATRWRAYPEVSDRLRFTERIPFDETRGYVKNVTRNMAVYGALYPEGVPVS